MGLKCFVGTALCAASFALLAGCGDETTVVNASSMQVLESGAMLKKCDDSNAGQLIFVADSNAAYFCAQGQWNVFGEKDRSVDTLVITKIDTIVKIDTVKTVDSTVIFDTTVVYDTTIVVDSIYVFDTTYVEYVPVYDTVTTEFLNQEMLAAGKYGYLLDARDNKVYRTIEIGSQTWMAQNLNYSDGGVVSVCYDGALDNCAKYGRLYSWAAAMNLDIAYDTQRASSMSGGDSILRYPAEGICPAGFHIPDSTEWMTLYEYVVSYNLVKGFDEGVGTSLKAAKSWTENEGVPEGTDRFGFSSISAGIVVAKFKGYANIGGEGSYWSSSEDRNVSSRLQSYAFRFAMFASNNDAYFGGSDNKGSSGDKAYSFSVRCVKN